MGVSTDLAPLGGMLDSLLDRLAALEKVADAGAPQCTPSAPVGAPAATNGAREASVPAEASPAVPTNGEGDAAQIASLQSEIAEEASVPAAASPAVPTNGEGDAAQIASLQSEIAELKSQLDASEKQRQRLERQLAAAGIKLAEDIPYDVARNKVQSIAERMQEIGSANVEIDGDEEKQRALREEYFVLELEMEKYNSALLTSDEYIAEGRAKEDQWERDTSQGNRLALLAVRRHMPVDIKDYSEARLTSEETPNGKVLPKAIAKKFKRCNVLQLLRMDPTSIARSHPASLENYRVNGMTLTERRAVYSHLTESKLEGGMTIAQSWAKNRKDQMVDRKWIWYTMMRDNLKSALTSYEAHVKQCGGPEDHACNLLGNQCPVRSDRNAINYYADDYGFPEGDEYQKREQAATISLSASPEKMADPTQLSEKRAKDEIENRKRLAVEEWKATYEKEYKAHTESLAMQEVKLEGLEEEIAQCKADEEEYVAEHQALKSELSGLPRGSKDRLPLMKKVNVAQTQAKEAKRRSAAATEELESLRADLEKDKKFVCSVPKPDWVEEGDGTDAASPSSSDNGAAFGQHTLRSAQSSRSNSSVGSDKPRGSPSGRGAGRGGLLAAIQGRGNGGGGRGSPQRAMSGGLLAGIQSRGKLGNGNGGSSDNLVIETTSNGAQEEKEEKNEGELEVAEPITNRSGTVAASEADKQNEPAETATNGSKEATLEKPNQYNGVGDSASATTPGNDYKSREAARHAPNQYNGVGDAASLFSSKEYKEARHAPNHYNGVGDAASLAPAKASKETARHASSSYSGLGAAASLAPTKDYESYKRKQSGGQGVNKTTLVSCPPPSQEAIHQRSERIRKEKEALEAKMRAQEAEEQLKKAAREKARIDAEARAERLKKEKEAREEEEAREREEAERKERERQEAKARQREEEAEKRRLAREEEKQRKLAEEQRRKDEKEAEQQGKIAELEERIKACQEDVATYEDEHQQCKQRLKELPRGSKDRLATMKEVNRTLTQAKEAKKAAAAAQEELDLYMKSK